MWDFVLFTATKNVLIVVSWITFEQTVEWPVKWDTLVFLWHQLTFLEGMSVYFSWFVLNNNKEYNWLILSLLIQYSDVIMSAMTYQITGVLIVYSTGNQRKYPSFASLAVVRGESTGDRWIPLTKAVTRKMFPIDDVIMCFVKVSYQRYHSTEA